MQPYWAECTPDKCNLFGQGCCKHCHRLQVCESLGSTTDISKITQQLVIIVACHSGCAGNLQLEKSSLEYMLVLSTLLKLALHKPAPLVSYGRCRDAGRCSQL